LWTNGRPRWPRWPPYQPGRFFERELPAIEAVLAGIDPVDLLIVDGFVQLAPQGTPGLGAYVHNALSIPVIGVAKSGFRSATHALEVRRGVATRPLYVTAAGIPDTAAAALVAEMAGRYRLPDALRRVDQLSRTVDGAPHPNG
jgi:deoxyribonuclease V